MALLVTGVAEHSVGESFVIAAKKKLPFSVICIDAIPNAWLINRAQYQDIRLDLNPLTTCGGIPKLAANLRTELIRALDALGEKHIRAVVQCAGVYWSGSLPNSGDDQRERLFGVNVIGRVEVLRAAMLVNIEKGADNSSTLIHVDVGSFQGLHARPERTLYAPSKSIGIDIAACLDAGKEVWRSVYFGPGPVDTYMLHFNHWVVKAGGPRRVLDDLRPERDLYRAIFVECSDEHFQSVVASNRFPELRTKHFDAYKAHREQTARTDIGVLTAEDCASMLVEMLQAPKKYASGVYLAKRPGGAAPTISFRSFIALSRHNAFGLGTN